MKDKEIQKYFDVHTEHCCAVHGCKYGDDNCTVFIAAKEQNYIQSFPCDECGRDGFETVLDMIKSLHPTYGDLDNQIIMYAKHQYGNSVSNDFTHAECLYKDLRVLIGEWTGCGYNLMKNGDVNSALISAFVHCGMYDSTERESLAEMMGWKWGRNDGALSDREPICVMLGAMAIAKAKWVYMPQKIKGINFKELIWEKSLTSNPPSDTV
jgi:hypothetical protein